MTKKVYFVMFFILLGALLISFSQSNVSAESSTCFDSDSGIDPFTAGNVTGMGPNGFTYDKPDTCVSDIELKEMRCVGDIPQGYRVDCEFGCDNGACLGNPSEITPSPIPTETPIPTSTPVPTPLPTVEPSNRNFLIIGWDGTHRPHLEECLAGIHPECASMDTIGSMLITEGLVTNGATDTKAGWAQITTGLTAEQSGVYSNGIYNPVPVGSTVFEKVEAYFGDENVTTFIISGKAVNTGDACVGEETFCSGQSCIEDQGQPFCYTSDLVDHYKNGTDTDLRGGLAVLNYAKDFFTAHQNDFFVGIVIFREPDVCGHISGENSAYYSECLQRNDDYTGELLAHLESLNILQHTDILMTSDHGFDDEPDLPNNRHGNAPYTFFATNNPSILVRNGDRLDVAPTVLYRYGIPLDGLEGYPLSLP